MQKNKDQLNFKENKKVLSRLDKNGKIYIFN